MYTIQHIDGHTMAFIDGAIEEDALEIEDGIDTVFLVVKDEAFRIRRPLRLSRVVSVHLRRYRQPLVQVFEQGMLAKLEYLTILASPEAMEGIEESGAIQSLMYLVIREQRLGSRVSSWIMSQSALKTLSLTGTDVSDSIIAHLGCRQTLRRLDLWNSPITFAKAVFVGEPFFNVKSLDVSETRVDSTSVDIIHTHFPSLERFVARGTMLTRKDVAMIAQWPGLRLLDTGFTDLDVGVDNDESW